MDENKTTNTNPESGAGEKTFTQEDVNKIVSDRLAREKVKAEAALAEKERQLAQRELHMTAKELLSEKGLPVQLFDALNCTDEETMKKSIATIEKAFNDYKANLPKPVFKSFQPGASEIMPNVEEAGDLEIRKAMGLRT